MGMDPNTVLRDIRALVADVANPGPFLQDIAQDLADAIENLDVWLEGGGFLPEAWQR